MLTLAKIVSYTYVIPFLMAMLKVRIIASYTEGGVTAIIAASIISA